MLKDKSEKLTKKLSLKTITLKDLQSFAGGGYGTLPNGAMPGNHNEIMVKFPNLAIKQKRSSKRFSTRKIFTLRSCNSKIYRTIILKFG